MPGGHEDVCQHCDGTGTIEEYNREEQIIKHKASIQMDEDEIPFGDN